MIKQKIEKVIIISFIGLLICIIMGFGSENLKPNLAVNASNQNSGVAELLSKFDEGYNAGYISKHAYDSLTEAAIESDQQQNIIDIFDNATKETLPLWVTRLGIIEPERMKKDPILSNSTSSENPSEGFNSVSLVYNGPYEIAVEEAAHIAANAKLYEARSYKAIGSHLRKPAEQPNPVVTYLNYDLESKDQNYLISIQVDPNGKMSIVVTDNKQLNDRLLSYAPLNNRNKSSIKGKK